ncbi:MAG: hypothetical protein H6R11_1817 [Proteobacteria bacterium]|jgi:hypothetical protein|nr:hypothetical protein [Pseudomonadota bacterium]MBS1173057.1 hypothetical protein [Pseudomonadota bacterium]
MALLDQIVEDRIQVALARGELDHLPGSGRPLQLDDDSMVPEHLRMGLRILRNAGMVPPEIESLREAHALGRLLQTAERREEQDRARRRFMMLLYRLEAAGLAHTSRAVLAEYQPALLRRLHGGVSGENDRASADRDA